MKRAFFLLGFSLCGSAIVIALGVMRSPILSFADVGNMFASVFFVDSITTQELKERYSGALQGNGRVRVLIVPGHDDEAWGTEFRGVREADMTVMVGEELSRILSADPTYEPILVRTRQGYAKEFQDYFEKEGSSIAEFVKGKKEVMRDLIRAGSVHMTEGVIHNSAPTLVATRLYALNKWANENNVDIVLHIHFNDYPGRPSHRAGRYNGFSIYVPDPQFSNARASIDVAESLFEQFSKFYAESNLPVEDSGVVEDHELIAIGSYNTLDPVGILIEYGYIYEQRFLDTAVRNAELRELSFQTYLGLNRFFGSFTETFRKYPTTLLPHRFDEALSQSSGTSPEVLSLQTALTLSGAYPPAGEDLHSCPRSGSYGSCTTRAVKEFQKEQGIAETGALDEVTRGKLNELYSK